MSTQVAGIEQASSTTFNLQSIGIKAGMIDEMWRDDERTELQRLAAFEVFPGLWCEAFWHEVGRRTHDAPGSPAHYETDVGANLRNEPPMVAMSVGKDDCEQRWIVFPQAGNLWNQGRVRFITFKNTTINEALVRDLAGGEFIAQQRNVVLVGGTEPDYNAHLTMSLKVKG